MKQKRVLRRRRANVDIEAVISYYLREAGAEVASDFVTRLEEVILSISRMPAAGSERYGQQLQIAGMRHWLMQRFPYLVFYIEKTDHVEVVRVLHERMDISSQLDDPEGLRPIS
ncbi:MAG: type II toxin-antitoxin system RelE/ParE family toxin [Pyrinomonadaceae bacterium]